MEYLNKAEGFNTPTQLPEDEVTAGKWQTSNRLWWESSPMRYDWHKTIEGDVGSLTYFNEIDERFFASLNHYMPWDKKPFENIIDFDLLNNAAVLEIGVGYGSHAQLIAPHCKRYFGIDITTKASRMTARRLRSSIIVGSILRMDAEKMGFADSSFDFVWSWGVIHHSADTFQILKEMHRVLRPGGRATVMIYHRSFWKYYVVEGLINGVVKRELWRKGSLHRACQSSTDGAIARYYRSNEWKKLCSGLFQIEKSEVAGQKTDIVPLPPGRLKSLLLFVLPDSVARIFTNHLKMGSFLIVQMRRI